MNVVIIGSGYVGLVTGCCLAEAGNSVTCVDRDAKKVAELAAGRLPFYEPELGQLLKTQLANGLLKFDTSMASAVAHADVVFLAVGTPSNDDGSADVSNLLACARRLGDVIAGDCLVVVKSTAPVGTSDRIEKILNTSERQAGARRAIRVACNPEFLAEGRAVRDFRYPDRIVIGANDAHSSSVLARLYAPFDTDGRRTLLMDRHSAEFAKYACNAMLAARISMINELSSLAGMLGADIASICGVLRGDPRIGASYLRPGIGYGGSCLPKDLSALIDLAQHTGEPAHMLRSIERVNMSQRQRLLKAIRDYFKGCLRGRRVAIWGLSFKPGTDDVRASPSVALIRDLAQEGASVNAYDPVARPTAQAALGDVQVSFGQSAMAVCEQADALIVMTEWDEFRSPDLGRLATLMRGNMVFDARTLYKTKRLLQHGLDHYRLGQIMSVSCDHKANGSLSAVDRAYRGLGPLAERSLI
ncbi:MAG TPA: UDP-glucose/GDP-mannose dehydrogenase family protein [Advenella sp.]|nr:UDP-glucose/GDP-mannose dehydrogenase family protein [Advenella sp.]